MAALLCTDDTMVVVIELHLSSGVAIGKRFEWRDHQFLFSDFKGVNILWEDLNVALSQLAYLGKKGKAHQNDTYATNLDLRLELTDDDASKHGTFAGSLPWTETETSFELACIASMDLWGKKKTVAFLNSCLEARAKFFRERLALLCKFPLDFTSIHIRVFFYGSFQNLTDKQSQIDYMSVLADGRYKTNPSQ